MLLPSVCSKDCMNECHCSSIEPPPPSIIISGQSVFAKIGALGLMTPNDSVVDNANKFIHVESFCGMG